MVEFSEESPLADVDPLPDDQERPKGGGDIGQDQLPDQAGQGMLAPLTLAVTFERADP
jgi:hypothetical protein